MSSNRSLVVSGLVAAIIAIALVSGAVFVGVLNTTTAVPLSPQGNGGTESTSAGTKSEVNVSSNQQTTPSAPNQPRAQSGGLALLMTDPPTVPSGVSAVYLSYADLGVHVAGLGNQTGWRVLNTAGRIDLLSVVNYTQTVALANTSAGDYNAIAFNVTSAVVTFQSQNFTADFTSKTHLIFLPIDGGLTVVSGKTAAALIDFTPTVLLVGNQSNPQFAFVPAAKAYKVPTQSVGTLHLTVGDKDDIHAATWWIQILHGSKFQITQLTLTPSKLSIRIVNSGNSTLFLRLADLSAPVSVAGGTTEVPNSASMLSISEVFAIEENTTLSPVIQIGSGAADAVIDTGGYVIPIGASVTFDFTGNISLGIAQSSTALHPHPALQIVPGRPYLLTLIGNGIVAEARVTATD